MNLAPMTPTNTPLLFQPLKLRSLELRNRIVISPMCQHAAERGHATPWHLVHLGKFALGGAGLILQVRTLPGERLSRGDRVVLIEHLESDNTYRVMSETAFHQQ